MTLKNKIQEAKDAINAALIVALETKTEYVLSDLFEVYKTLKTIDSKVYDNITFNNSISGDTFTSPFTAYNQDLISFNSNADTIRLG
jgi:hypothetical protein